MSPRHHLQTPALSSALMQVGEVLAEIAASQPTQPQPPAEPEQTPEPSPDAGGKPEQKS